MLWQYELARWLRQKESYGFVAFWSLTLLLLAGLGRAVPVATAYTNIQSTLMTVVGLVAPLLILLTVSIYWSNEQESKRLKLFRTYRVSTVMLIIIRYTAFLGSQLLVLAISFGLAALFIPLGAKTWMLLFAYVFMLIAYGAALGTLIGLWARTRMRSVLVSFAVWAILVLLWPTILVTVVSLFPFASQAPAMVAALFVNGFDLLRVVFSVHMGSPDAFGEAYGSLFRWVSTPFGLGMITVAIVLTIVVSLLLSHVAVQREETR